MVGGRKELLSGDSRSPFVVQGDSGENGAEED